MTEQAATEQPTGPGPQAVPPHAGQYGAPYGTPYYGAPHAGPKRLTRTPDDKMVAGVCGGLARYLNVDPTLVRVGAVISLFIGFPAVLLGYLVAWAIVPKG